MADNLPLIPEKQSAVCTDVRVVLRKVFRELDYLPPLVSKTRQRKEVGEDGDTVLPNVDQWINKYGLECKEIWRREGELKQQHAKRISREPLPNIYKLYSPQDSPAQSERQLHKVASWKKNQGFLQRKDLMPLIKQNSRRGDTLWVKSILNKSSGELSAEVKGTKVHVPVKLTSPKESSFQSISIGEIIIPTPLPAPPSAPPLLLPEYIICVPEKLNFINFTVGQLFTQSIRLVNVSKFECRLSVRPPGHQELLVELCGSRGLTVTAGSATELKIHFRPRDVRVLTDVLYVRVSVGRSLVVPICCFMEPPLLDILVPAVPTSIVSYSVSDMPPPARPSPGMDVVELGARLLGDVHCVRVLLNCEAAHASFFLLTEDAWVTFCLDALTSQGSLLADPFIVQPAYWAGGGTIQSWVWCRATETGVHAAALRVLASTSIVRPLHLLADSLYYRPDHVTIQAKEKDYDICSDDDPTCDCFVHLGIAFPHRSLSATVQLFNHSPMTYSYYWSVRPWGVCSCWEEEKESQGSLQSDDNSERLCVGAREARQTELQGLALSDKSAQEVRVEPARGSLGPRSTCSVYVCVPDVGSVLGTRRAVLMLILKDIPRESFPKDYDPMIVKTEEVNSEPIPGIEGWTREVCEIVCAQMEVWWEVAPVRFVLDPPVLPLIHSRRVNSIDVMIRSTQLFGCEAVRGRWQVPQPMPVPPTAQMTPAHSCAMTVRCPLPVLPNHFAETDVITLKATDYCWESSCAITRQCATRHPALRPATVWLGVVPPGTHMNATVNITNDTHQRICWWATPYRWHGENVPSRACAGRAPCEECHERNCTCALLRPARGGLAHGDSTAMYYDVNAPEVDGCVATLVQACRTSADVCRVSSGSGVEARATLFSYRVLAPRLMLRVLPCLGDKKGQCKICDLDEGSLNSARGTATLRPRTSLDLHQMSCYRVRVTNLTSIPSVVTWDTPLEEDVLKVLFIPKELQVDGHGEIEFQVVLDAKKVCGRRIFVYRAQVRHAYKPLYLIIDTAISGLEILCEVPIGENMDTDSTLILRRTQREVFPWDADKVKPTTSMEIFAEEDRKRAIISENICHCPYELVYIEPVKRPRRPPQGPDDYPPVEIVTEPPSLTRVCPCFACTRPILTKHTESFCLQFKQMPLKTVWSRTLRLRNESVQAARWTSAVRCWQRHHTRTLGKDEWAQDVRDPGVLIDCVQKEGLIGPRAFTDIHVQVYADCWGLYHDQLMINIDHVEPIVLDVWVEAVGSPLLFALNLANDESPVLLWMSASDPERTLRVKNNSRTDLTVQCYVVTENEYVQDVLPFRLYLRFFDVLPRTCPCITARNSGSIVGEDSAASASVSSSYEEEMDTGFEIFLSPDYGRQGESYFKISPELSTVPKGSWAEWKVELVEPPPTELAPHTAVVFRSLPAANRGEGWFRPDPLPKIVRLRQSERFGRLKVSGREIHVKLCALDLPYKDVLRVRRRFRIQNIGNGPLDIMTRTKVPWSLVLGDEHAACGAGCACGNHEQHRECQVPLYLLPRSSMELCVEVRVCTEEEWPSTIAPEPSVVIDPSSAGTIPPPAPCHSTPYDQWKRTLTKMRFYDTDNVLLTLPLHLEIEYPIISIEPALIDFGFVTDGDTRKGYFTVSHSSRTVTIDMLTEWVGGPGFRLWPRDFSLQPGGRERVYIQYTARWCGAPEEGCVRVAATCGAREWCGVEARVRAIPARDADRKVQVHDHTDDTHLLHFERSI